ncbi:SpoIIE family protein phosphatase [Yinghuangia soli]|uniref:SpoIIE family protein phosphatase n=1 Tax=Yinghuangia soli TaxID=2908204 RepID=A0AA41U3F9_9ACTN|nr:SpoIIE family protein phosphatase [Yinghuangia soli]MCF2528014.1 SpoIIE family protein phosphatase [Yinghuangia soli]
MLVLLDAPDMLLGSAVPGSAPHDTLGTETGSLRLAVRIPDNPPNAPANRIVYAAVTSAFGTRVLFGEAAASGARGAAIAARLLDAFRAGAAHEPELNRVAYQMAHALRGEREGGRELARVTLLEHRADGRLAIVDRAGPVPLQVGYGTARPLAPPLPQPPIGVLNPGSLRVPAHLEKVSPGDRILLHTGAPADIRNGIPGQTGSAPADGLRGLLAAGAVDGPFDRALDRLAARGAEAPGTPLPESGALCLVEIGDPADATAPTGPREVISRARRPRNPLRTR